MDKDRKEILETAEKWSKALVSNDAEAIGSFMSDEWVIVGSDGITAKHDFLPHVASGALTHEAMDLVGEPRIQIYDDMAVLSARVTNNGHFKGGSVFGGRMVTDVFKKYGEKWLCVHSHITPAVDRR